MKRNSQNNCLKMIDREDERFKQIDLGQIECNKLVLLTNFVFIYFLVSTNTSIY